jgi:hypothetical protein
LVWGGHHCTLLAAGDIAQPSPARSKQCGGSSSSGHGCIQLSAASKALVDSRSQLGGSGVLGIELGSVHVFVSQVASTEPFVQLLDQCRESADFILVQFCWGW